MPKKILVLLVVSLCLISSFSVGQNARDMGRVLSYIASLYVPADCQKNAGIMTFGSEFNNNCAPVQNYLK
jgi:hypothetical protein